ncbi:response regulator [Paenibacillus hemerocallicola]|jgi:two-component system chemotaxis response regulator CheY|uniref:Response regulator n=1 Tax=Paenibacillus hemerocallicola TaxID=1172614 RepID=A0A5C4T0A2_9BACL|nr:response regulator [Paenibacillus hemerocallicola]TNJ62538.1 response regulator [Paenibacillus hemerocallicola]
MAKILIVDDSSVMRKNIRTVLERAGHEVVGEASDGREVLTSYINLRPDLITLDISMPTMDGTDAIKTLLRSFPQAKVVMVSAIGQKQQVLDAIKLGAKSYIVKPFEADKLLEVVDKVVRL